MITDKPALQNAFKTETGKNALFKNGKVRKAFLSWNMRQLNPESKLESVCEELQIGIDIEQPFASKKLFEYRSNKKPLKVFKEFEENGDEKKNHACVNGVPN